MSCVTFEPLSTSTPKKFNSTLLPNLCSTPRPAHVRYSLAKCAPLPIDSSTPQMKCRRQSFAPDIHQLMYRSSVATANSLKIWVL